MRAFVGSLMIVILGACGSSGGKSIPVTATDDSTAHLAHEAYTTAINSNNLDSIAGMFTEDVVFLAAHAPPIVGKAAVRAWAQGYLQAFTTHWDKTSQEFVVAADWAFERYTYKSTDTPKDGSGEADPLLMRRVALLRSLLASGQLTLNTLGRHDFPVATDYEPSADRSCCHFAARAGRDCTGTTPARYRCARSLRARATQRGHSA